MRGENLAGKGRESMQGGTKEKQDLYVFPSFGSANDRRGSAECRGMREKIRTSILKRERYEKNGEKAL